MNASTTLCASGDAYAPDPVYALRDDLVREHNLRTVQERMLATAVAQAWLRLQDAHKLERAVYAHTSRLELFTTSLDAFKALNRHIAECERMWRRAVDELEAAKRKSAAAVPPPPASRLPRLVPRNTPPPRSHATSTSARSQPEPDPRTDASPPDDELLQLG